MTNWKSWLLAGVAAVLLGSGPAAAQPLRIGMEEDLSTSMSSVYGQGAVVAAQMAVEDFGPRGDRPEDRAADR